MATPQLMLIGGPRSVCWEAFADLGLPNSLALTWQHMPNDGEPGFLMPEILWQGFAALDLTDILFAATPEEAPAPSYRRIAPQLALAKGRDRFLQSFDMDGADSWHGGQCYFALKDGTLPKRSDPVLSHWLTTPRNRTTTGEPPFPTHVPHSVPLLLKVQAGEDAASAVAFADSADTLAAFDQAICTAAKAASVEVSHPAERDLFTEDIQARYGPVPS